MLYIIMAYIVTVTVDGKCCVGDAGWGMHISTRLMARRTRQWAITI